MAQGPRPRLTPDIQTTLRGLLASPQPSGGGLLTAPAKAPPVPPPPAPSQREQREPGWLTYLLGGSNGMAAARNAPYERAMQEQRLAAMQGLSGLFGGGAQGPAQGLAGAPLDKAPDVPTGSGTAGLPSLREAAPALMRAQLAGIDGVSGLRETLEAVQPELEIVNGVGVDRRDPNNVGRRVGGVNLSNVNGFQVDPNDPENVNRYLPDIPEGAEPVYDARGRVVGIRNMDGAVQALGQRTRAVADAGNASEASYAEVISGGRARGSAPYEFVNVPTPTGAPAVISRAQAANGMFVGQAPADAVRAEGVARNEVAAQEEARVRATAAVRTLPALNNMARLLPDVISGFGSDVQIGTQRALAAGGNADASRRVTATQTFQNEARQIVAGILPMFGTNPTEGERKYAEQMGGADVSYTPETLRTGIGLAVQRTVREAAAAGMEPPRLPARLAELLPPGTEFIGEDGVRRRTR